MPSPTALYLRACKPPPRPAQACKLPLIDPLWPACSCTVDRVCTLAHPPRPPAAGCRPSAGRPGRAFLTDPADAAKGARNAPPPTRTPHPSPPCPPPGAARAAVPAGGDTVGTRCGMHHPSAQGEVGRHTGILRLSKAGMQAGSNARRRTRSDSALCSTAWPIYSIGCGTVLPRKALTNKSTSVCGSYAASAAPCAAHSKNKSTARGPGPWRVRACKQAGVVSGRLDG